MNMKNNTGQSHHKRIFDKVSQVWKITTFLRGRKFKIQSEIGNR